MNSNELVCLNLLPVNVQRGVLLSCTLQSQSQSISTVQQTHRTQWNNIRDNDVIKFSFGQLLRIAILHIAHCYLLPDKVLAEDWDTADLGERPLPETENTFESLFGDFNVRWEGEGNINVDHAGLAAAINGFWSPWWCK